MSKGRTVPPQVSPPQVLSGGIETHPAIPGIAREMCLTALAEGHSIATMIQLVEQTGALSEHMIATSAAHERVVCKAGCAWCCYTPFITTTAAEVITIAAFLRDTLDPAALAMLVQRLKQRAGVFAALQPEQRNHARVACALLVDNRCSVHMLRPLACRGWVSSDVRACEATYESGWESPVPNGRRHLGITAGVREGMRQALETSGLEDEQIDLTRGLLVILSEPERIDRWLAGESVFAEARA